MTEIIKAEERIELLKKEEAELEARLTSARAERQILETRIEPDDNPEGINGSEIDEATAAGDFDVQTRNRIEFLKKSGEYGYEG